MSARSRGHRVEQRAAAYLQSLGYQLVCCNYHGSRGEIDIIAWEQTTLCFVEVRSRSHDRFGHPLETISVVKQQRIVQTAQQYLQSQDAWAPVACRFDVVTFLAHTNVFELHRNAFSA